MKNTLFRLGPVLLLALSFGAAQTAHAARARSNSRRTLATITGSVADQKGNPLAGALITFVRDGVSGAARQTLTMADGSFLARVAPGMYALRANADGFNAAGFDAVQVKASQELVYRFNLQPAGEGLTLPEQKRDRDDPKYTLRSVYQRRSVLQLDGDSPPEVATVVLAPNAPPEDSPEPEAGAGGPVEGVVETFASSPTGIIPASVGTNFAVSTPVNDRLEILFAGTVASNGYDRFETIARLRAGDNHRLSASLGAARMPIFIKSVAADATSSATAANPDDDLSQVSLRASDEWVVRSGVVVVLGMDYSRFVGASNSGYLSPRFGFALDANSRTRLKAAYSQGDTAPVESVASFESGPVVFKSGPDQPVSLAGGRLYQARSHRMEVGLERVLDNSSTIEATVFFDTVDNHDVGLLNLPFNAFSGDNGAAFAAIAGQTGGARGVRVVYSRRISSFLKASAGYAMGRGEELATEPGTPGANPGNLFRATNFQSAAAQVDAGVARGTRVRAILRFSPEAAVFDIDPFAGRLAVYDPSLSILVTQDLPSFGLPIRAEAILDARNLLDSQAGGDEIEKLTCVGLSRRSLRGGISIRF